MTGAVNCPWCHNETRITDSRPSTSGVRVVRRRVCRENSKHVFKTTEVLNVESLSAIGVRRSGDQELAAGGFDWSRLVRDVQNGVLKYLSESEVVDVCTSALKALELELPRIQKPLSRLEARVRPDLRGWISDVAIASAVDHELRRRRTQVAHVMYALSVEGRADREGRQGWKSATDFLEWLTLPSNYPDLARTVEAGGMPTSDTWYPASSASGPAEVIKRNGNAPPFRRPQFEASIRKALLGRAEAKHTAEFIAEWVLWGLKGQRRVHSTQLAVGVLECLRRVDDIAYLRWAAVAKGLTTVPQVCDEVIGLIEAPSTRLVFDPDARPRRPSAHPTA